MFRILHTSDWHLGHSLHGFSREQEHQAFFTWLLESIAEYQVDALLVAGDLFDSANPPAKAWQQLYQFLAKLRRQFPDINIVLTGGNHDSPTRINAPHPLLQEFDVHLIGHLQKTPDGMIDSKHIIPLYDKEKNVQAMVAAIPFLRSCDLLQSEGKDTSLEQGFAAVYQQAHQQCQTFLDTQQLHVPIIAMAHAYLVGGELSPLSERKVLGGNQHAIPAGVFEQHFDYSALGHLHLAQKVAENDCIRYCGSPIPLSMSEHNYPHQIRLVDIKSTDQGFEINTQRVLIPRKRDMLMIPVKPKPLTDVLAQLAALEIDREIPAPFVQVNVLLDKPEPLLKEQVQQAIEGKNLVITRIAASYPEKKANQKSVVVSEKLDDMTPENVFSQYYQQTYQQMPEQELISAFHQIVDASKSES
ncbi:exonuclease SbcCD subunit D C-terminal domain-containing protein [Catenovulum sp. SM1970]|uniref:exonuclease SbcCD subunit D C-terminal domain-containing protein n=1 Tax=Marinifaba aquimaris TaxID=2741323 RepID=UPI001573DE69|nr:exonuclease SbcCD subunit D C-terminal domain-containing protein [Marinifaba aquimaris]NTS77648.1 exonuclease SbcCD subunit D C-terminal domain-containing protein [Marinifaba aquimaris]